MNRNHVFDSSGPDLRIRGTAQQLSEKYLQLGRDASSSGDRVMAESYYQHAEHYFRILNAMAQAAQQGQAPGDRSQGREGAGGQNGNAPGQYSRRQPDREEGVGDDDQPDPLVPTTGDAESVERYPAGQDASEG